MLSICSVISLLTVLLPEQDVGGGVNERIAIGSVFSGALAQGGTISITLWSVGMHIIMLLPLCTHRQPSWTSDLD